MMDVATFPKKRTASVTRATTEKDFGEIGFIRTENREIQIALSS